MHEILALFAQTEVFIFVFMEILSKLDLSSRILALTATWKDKIIFISLMGWFSIFGTLFGFQIENGAITNIRDLGPLVAGLCGGPFIGFVAGAIGGFHRFMLGGITAIPCGLSTMIAGLIGGGVYLLNKKKLVGVLWAILLAVAVEVVHGALTLLLARPFDEALVVVKHAIPPMMLANGLGIAVSIIVLDRLKPRKPDQSNSIAWY